MTVTVTWDGTNGAGGDGVIDTADNVGNWTAIKITSGGQAPTAVAADAAYEGTNNVTCRSDNKRVYMYTDIGVGNELNFTGGGNAEGELIYIWVNFLASSLLGTQAAGSLGVFLESSTPSSTQYHLWYFYGADNYTGGWKRLVLDPTKTVSASSGTAIDLTSVRYIGAFAQTVATAKFDNFVVDQCAVGKGIKVTGSSTLGLMEELLANEEANRYGVLTALNDSGTAYQLSGRLTLGDNVGVLASNITDEDSKIFLAEPLYYQGAVLAAAPLTYTGLDIVGNATGATDVSLGQQVGTTQGRNGISIIGNDTYTMDLDTDDTAVESSDFFGCTLENITGTLNIDGNHNFDSVTMVSCSILNVATGMTINNLSSVNSGQIILTGLAALVDSLVVNNVATVAITVADLGQLTNCRFTSDGTGHAVDLGTISVTDTMSWNNTDTGYAGTNGATGNETILVNVATSQTLTINVGSGYSTPTIYNTGAGTVSVVSGQVTLTITVRDINDATLLENARVYVTAAAGGSLTVGTVIIDKALTNVSGVVTDTRSYSTDQPIEGVVRFSTSPNFYKTSPISGTVNNASGLSLNIQMIKDV